MNETHDTNETATADNGGELDPQEAATLLEQTKRQAQRKFDPKRRGYQACDRRGQREVPGAAGRDRRPGGGMGRRVRVHGGALSRWSEPRDRLWTVSGHGAADHRRRGRGGIAQGRAEWPAFGAALTVAVVAAGGAFAGPAGAWAVAGVGLFVALLGHTAATAWLHRA
jgi:hypothetical protein